MINTTAMLNENLKTYANPGAVIRRMVRDGELISIRKGLYETDPNTPGICLAMSVCGPSYISFDYALSYYGLIPEAVTRYTSATLRKNKTKEFNTPFGIYSYRDVPDAVYPWGLILRTQNSYPFMIACPEKALCDKLYTISPVRNRSEIEALLFEDLRIDQFLFRQLDMNRLLDIASLYKTINHRIFQSFIQKEFRHAGNH